MPRGSQPAPGAREGNRGTTLQPARPAHTPGTGSSDKPLPGLATTLRPKPAAQRLALPVPGAELAIPRSLPPCRRRRRRSRWSARSAARTNDLEVRQDDGHTRPRGRPGAKDRCESHSARRAPHKPRRTPPKPLDTKRHSFWSTEPVIDSLLDRTQIRSIWRQQAAAGAWAPLSTPIVKGPVGPSLTHRPSTPAALPSSSASVLTAACRRGTRRWPCRCAAGGCPHSSPS